MYRFFACFIFVVYLFWVFCLFVVVLGFVLLLFFNLEVCKVSVGRCKATTPSFSPTS